VCIGKAQPVLENSLLQKRTRTFRTRGLIQPENKAQSTDQKNRFSARKLGHPRKNPLGQRTRRKRKMCEVPPRTPPNLVSKSRLSKQKKKRREKISAPNEKTPGFVQGRGARKKGPA